MRGSERLKTPQQYVEWCNLEHMLLIQLHSLTNLSPPLISHATLSSFPPGEAKGQLQELVPFNVLLCSVRKWRLRRWGRQIGDPCNGCAKSSAAVACGEAFWTFCHFPQNP